MSQLIIVTFKDCITLHILLLMDYKSNYFRWYAIFFLPCCLL